MTNQTLDTEIDALNDVTKVLIDSKKGYEKCYELADDGYALRAQFLKRANERADLVSRIQHHVRTLGGEPQTDGGTLGTLHRGFTQFVSLFRDDEKAALEAVDDGEEYLAKAIEDRLEKSEVQGQARALLQDALRSAREGEAFADRLT
tara:strand:- start:1042 stop:1485 length:444 start_codon:yes stop_codon:yes gene_type:complete